PSFHNLQHAELSGYAFARMRRILAENLEPRCLLATTYYVSPAGNDTWTGTSTAAPWKSIARVNHADLNAGDRVLFEGGKTFSITGALGPELVSNGTFESGLGSWSDTWGTSATYSLI